MNSLSSWIVIRRLRLPFLIIILTFAISILGMVLIPGVDDKGEVYHLNFFDAFYFVSYMASTIGFGESPYTFTYPQRLWVSFSLYITVVGWFYGIGSIIALMQDKVLSLELARSSFIKSVEKINEPFILVFGYNNVTKKLIEKLNRDYKRMVIIDKDQDKIDALRLENYHPFVPGFAADVLDPELLKITGILSQNCQAAIIVFEDDKKNTTLAMKCQYLNKNVSLLVRSSSIENSDYLYSLGLSHIENPFKVISNRLSLALSAPHLWLLELWVYGRTLKLEKKDIIPKGNCVVYGYGRMGKALESGLKKAEVNYSFIDSGEIFAQENHSHIYGNDTVEEKLIEAGIKNASIVIAGTRDDMVNLAIIFIAKKLNPDIYTIARENEIEDVSIFDSAPIDRNYVLEEIVSNKIYNYLAMPLANRFVKLLNDKDENWGKNLVNRIVTKMGCDPYLCEMSLSQKQANAVSISLMKNNTITLGVLKRSRKDYEKNNNVMFLMLVREGKEYLLPDDNFQVRLNDVLLVVCHDKESETDLAYVLNNIYELHYVMYGREKISGVLGKLLKA